MLIAMGGKIGEGGNAVWCKQGTKRDPAFIKDFALYIEDARGELLLDNGANHVELDTIIARRDCIINHVKQSACGLVPEIQITFPHYRSEKPITIVYEQQDDYTVSYTVTRILSGVSLFVTLLTIVQMAEIQAFLCKINKKV